MAAPGEQGSIQVYLGSSKVDYPTLFRNDPARAIYNVVLEFLPSLGEFSSNAGKRALTSLERAYQDYIKQSEMKRPNAHPDYLDMEYWADLPPDFWPLPEFPESDYTWGDGGGGYVPLLFSVFYIGDACKGGGSSEHTAVGRYPIYNLRVEKGNAVISNVSGYGSTRVAFTLTVAEKEKGPILIESTQTSPDVLPAGKLFYPNNFIRVEEDCCEPFEWDSDSNAETIARNQNTTLYVIGGTPPYTWEVGGTDEEGHWFTLPIPGGPGIPPVPGSTTEQTSDLFNVLYADGSSCGTAEITVTDSCDPPKVVYGYLRNTTGAWVFVSNNCGIVAPEDDNGAYALIQPDCAVTNTLVLEDIEGKKRQTEGFTMGTDVRSGISEAVCIEQTTTECGEIIGDCFNILDTLTYCGLEYSKCQEEGVENPYPSKWVTECLQDPNTPQFYSYRFVTFTGSSSNYYEWKCPPA